MFVGSALPSHMTYVLIIHEVEDYRAWKAIFDQAAGLRKAAGESSFQLLCAQRDVNKIVHFSQWTSHDAAHRFFESPEVEEIRRVAGVKSPDFIYLDEIEHGTL